MKEIIGQIIFIVTYGLLYIYVLNFETVVIIMLGQLLFHASIGKTKGASVDD